MYVTIESVTRSFMRRYFISLFVFFLTALGALARADAPQSLPNQEVAQSQILQEIEGARAFVLESVQGNPQAMQSFERLAVLLEEGYDEQIWNDEEISQIVAAITFAANQHRGQTRKNDDRTPYLAHPLDVTVYLVDKGQVQDPNTIIASLLHDTTNLAEVEKKFNKQVAGYINELLENPKLSKEEQKRQEVIQASHRSRPAAEIKLADQLYNLSELLQSPPKNWSRAQIDAYYQWAQTIIDRLPSKANPSLKQAVQAVVTEYWESQTSS